MVSCPEENASMATAPPLASASDVAGAANVSAQGPIDALFEIV